MNATLGKWLKKIGVKNPNELKGEEKQTFENWQAILSKEELTIQDIETFCKMQIEAIEGKWRDLTIMQDRKAELIPYHTVYKAILSALGAPKVAREALERQLTQLLQGP